MIIFSCYASASFRTVDLLNIDFPSCVSLFSLSTAWSAILCQTKKIMVRLVCKTRSNIPQFCSLVFSLDSRHWRWFNEMLPPSQLSIGRGGFWSNCFLFVLVFCFSPTSSPSVSSACIWNHCHRIFGSVGNSFHLPFVFLAHHFSMVMSLGLIFFSCFRPSSSECNPSHCILVHLASLYCTPFGFSLRFHPSPASYLQVHSEGDEPCIDKISSFFFLFARCLFEGVIYWINHFELVLPLSQHWNDILWVDFVEHEHEVFRTVLRV